MADITKCASKDCLKGDSCYRKTAVDSYWQSWNDFSSICSSENNYEEYIDKTNRLGYNKSITK